MGLQAGHMGVQAGVAGRCCCRPGLLAKVAGLRGLDGVECDEDVAAAVVRLRGDLRRVLLRPVQPVLGGGDAGRCLLAPRLRVRVGLGLVPLDLW